MKQNYGLSPEMYTAIVALVDDRLKEVRVFQEAYQRLERGQERLES